MNTRWNYKVVEVKPNMIGKLKRDAVQDALAQLGAQGWELVSVAHVGFAAWLYLKKEQ